MIYTSGGPIEQTRRGSEENQTALMIDLIELYNAVP